MEIDYTNDANYKRFTSHLEAALSLFDSVQDWTDVINFLTKISKILSSFTQFSIIPRRSLVSKRLGQCLNPALPSGVHQKALEVYRIIFKSASQPQLILDLPLWSSGLFPFLQYASISVKPSVLSLYRDFYLPLGSSLKPCLKGLLLGLLPCLEEEENHVFNLGMDFLNELGGEIGFGYFYSCLWLAILTTPSCRQAALVFLLKKYPKTCTREDLALLFGPDPPLLIKAWAACLQDSVVLVQRFALELLLLHLPIQSPMLSFKDALELTLSALRTLERRDSSLIRRFYSWILSSHSFIQGYSLRVLKESITRLGEDGEMELALRILSSLMDKDEIGPFLMDELFIEFFEKFVNVYESVDENQRESLILCARALFNNMESRDVWKHFCTSCTSHATRTDVGTDTGTYTGTLPVFIINHFDWKDQETVNTHFLYFLQFSIDSIVSNLSSSSDSMNYKNFQQLLKDSTTTTTTRITKRIENVDWNFIQIQFDIVFALLNSISASSLISPESTNNSETLVETLEEENWENQIQEFNRKIQEFYKVLDSTPINPKWMGLPCLERIYTYFIYMMSLYGIHFDSNIPTSIKTRLTCTLCQILTTFPSIIPPQPPVLGFISHCLMNLCIKLDSKEGGLQLLIQLIECLLILIPKEMSIPIHSMDLYTQFIQSSWSKLWNQLESLDDEFICRFFFQLCEFPFAISILEMELLKCILLSLHSPSSHPSSHPSHSTSMVKSNQLHVKQVKNVEKMGKFLGLLLDLGLGNNKIIKLVAGFSRPLCALVDCIQHPSLSVSFMIKKWILTFPSPCLFILLFHLKIMKFSNGKDDSRLYYSLESVLNLLNLNSDFFIKSCLGFMELPLNLLESLESLEMNRHEVNLLDLFGYILCLILNYPVSHYVLMDLPMDDISLVPMDDIINLKGMTRSRIKSLICQILLILVKSGQMKREILYYIHECVCKELQTCIKHSIHVNQLLYLELQHLLVVSINSLDCFLEFIQLFIQSVESKENRTVLEFWIHYFVLKLDQSGGFIFDFIPSSTSTSTSSNPSSNPSTNINTNTNTGQQIIQLFIQQIFHTTSRKDTTDLKLLLNGLDVFISFYFKQLKQISTQQQVSTSSTSLNKTLFLPSISDYMMGIPSFQESSSSESTTFTRETTKEAHLGLGLPSLLECILELHQETLDKGWIDIRRILYKIVSSCIEFDFELTCFSLISLFHSLKESFVVESETLRHVKQPLLPLTDKTINMYNLLNSVIKPQFLFIQLLSLIKKYPKNGHLIQFVIYFLQTLKKQDSKQDSYKDIHYDSFHAFATNQFKSDIQDGSLTFEYLQLSTLVVGVSTVNPSFRVPDYFSRLFEWNLTRFELMFLELLRSHKESLTSPLKGNVSENVSVKETTISYEKEKQEWQAWIDYLQFSLAPLLPHIYDSDKLNSILVKIQFAFISPTLKSKKPPIWILKHICTLLNHLVSIIPSSTKIWKREVWDYFNDLKFFKLNFTMLDLCKSLVKDICSVDSLNELLIKTSPMSNSSIFISRDQELSTRIQAWKRVSFLVFIHNRDDFAHLLPLIQEKLVEAFKSFSDALHLEAFTLLRVLLLRVSIKKLTSFWSLIISECIKCFGNALKNTLDLDLLLMACKFLDLALLLRIEELQYHLWIFVVEFMHQQSSSDTSMMRLLSSKVSSSSSPRDHIKDGLKDANFYREKGYLGHSKLLLTMKKIQSVQELYPFMRHLGSHVYYNILDHEIPDLILIDKVVLNDFVDFIIND